jgi:protein-tyrosine phosphatase
MGARFVDLHCHYVPGIDDGVRNADEGVALLAALAKLGFERVIATPHMRPGLFDNRREDIERAFAALEPRLSAPGLPATALSSEHYFDDVVYQRLLDGQALPYPGGRAVLLEFYEIDFPPMVARCFAELRRRGLLPVIAHPERYRCLWHSPETLERLVDSGAATLLDAAALVGKYGRQPQRTAETLLEQGLYHAACSDAHRPEDVADVARGLSRIEELYGAAELEFLFDQGPRAILAGELPD